nr:uncharacterized protein LOC126545999 [Dermacentor andersoni]
MNSAVRSHNQRSSYIMQRMKAKSITDRSYRKAQRRAERRSAPPRRGRPSRSTTAGWVAHCASLLYWMTMPMRLCYLALTVPFRIISYGMQTLVAVPTSYTHS